MASIGTIKQYRAPFLSPIQLLGNCIIGISIGEDDYMLLGSTSGNQSFRFKINNKLIWMGRTYIYLTEEQVNDAVIEFPDGAPPSTLIEAIYYSRN